MKMKKACEATALTERAIRLYISKGLITPRQKDGLIDFSPEDIQLLQDIALLRQADFSMEQIARMLANASDIPAILAARADAACASAEHESELYGILTALEPGETISLHALSDGIRARRIISAPDFARFDEISDELRQTETRLARREVAHQQKRQQRLQRLGWLLFVIAALLAATQFLLSRVRIEGYIQLAPVTVVSVDGSYATFCIGNEQALDILGRDVITVPYRVDGVAPDGFALWGITAPAAGDVFLSGKGAPTQTPEEVLDEGCKLAVRLTVGDLLRLGISPFQDFSPDSAQRQNEWATFILHALFEDGRSDECTLWLRYPPSVRPLLREN